MRFSTALGSFSPLVLERHLFHFGAQGSVFERFCPAMRRLFAHLLLVLCAAVPAWSALHADPGTEVERVSSASALADGHGAVVISIRSEIYLEDRLDVYFLREGGSRTNDADIVRFGRKQGLLSLGNDTVNYKIRAYQLPAGTYRLIAHGVGCPKIPTEEERCLVDVSGIFGSAEFSRASRGYPAIAPSFEVRAGTVTHAGDFALTARNMIEWSEIPREEISGIERRFASLPRAPEPLIPGEYRRKYGLFPRSLEDDWDRRY